MSQALINGEVVEMAAAEMSDTERLEFELGLVRLSCGISQILSELQSTRRDLETLNARLEVGLAS